MGSTAISAKTWGTLPSGQTATLYTLTHASGISAEISDFGGTIVRLFTADKDGNLADITLGFESLADYVAKSPFFGCTVGRYGNRIAGGRFSLDGVEHKLVTNESPSGKDCTLHGGKEGFDKRLWTASHSVEGDSVVLSLELVSPAGDQGFPGTLTSRVVYTLSADTLRIDYHATTDAPTVYNPTNHAYFNLGGEASGDILGHQVTLNASAFTPVDDGLIPTGELRPVEGTPLDFRIATEIGDRIEDAYDQLVLAGGYDHNFVLDRTSDGLALAAHVVEPGSGRTLEIWTTEPAIQLYTGNFLDGSLVGKTGVAYGQRSGFCLETQHFPDSPNQPEFPTTVLRPGETFHSATEHRFGTV